MKAGDKKTIDCTFPKDYLAKELAGKKAKFDVTVKQVAGPELAKLDDEFAKKLGYDTLAALRDAVEARVKDEYESVSKARLKRELLDQSGQDSQIRSARHARCNESSTLSGSR